MQGLANPNLKVRRAKEHLDALKRAIEVFVESQPYTIITEDNLDAGQYVIKFRYDSPSIWPIGAILGDFICCLRSSLDHLIFGLVKISGGTPTKATSFPIIGEFTRSTPATIKDAINGIPPEAASIVKLFQPYNHGNHYRDTHLWRLNILWNIDKHRYIPVHSSAAEIPFRMLPIIAPIIDNSVDDYGIVRFPLSVKNQVRFDPPKIQIWFGAAEDGVCLKFEDLAEIYQFINEGIIPRFKCFFPESEVKR